MIVFEAEQFLDDGSHRSVTVTDAGDKTLISSFGPIQPDHTETDQSWNVPGRPYIADRSEL